MSNSNKTFADLVREGLAESELLSNPPHEGAGEHIIGWVPKDHEELRSLGVPNAPTGFVHVIGAEALEWPIKECASSHIYLVDERNLIGDVTGKCFGRPLQLWRRTPDVRLWLAGYASLRDQQHEEQSGLPGDGGARPSQEDDHPIEGVLDVHPLTSLSAAYDAYVDSCDCGDRFSDNCAHFVSNALIRAGYTLGGGTKCRCGRLIRAKELLAWVRSRPGRRFSQNHQGLSSGVWIVYQERDDGQGHILFHKEASGRHSWKGTGDYPDWPVQWHYSF